jgi:hypothetical protein
VQQKIGEEGEEGEDVEDDSGLRPPWEDSAYEEFGCLPFAAQPGYMRFVR